MFRHPAVPTRDRPYRHVQHSTLNVRPGFTLIELTAVLVIMTLLASAVVISVKPTLDIARRDVAIERLLANDHRLREQAVRSGMPLDVVFDLDRGELKRGEPHDRWQLLEQGLPMRSLSTGTKSYTQGIIRLRYAADGSSPTYALTIGGNAIRSKYLLIVGGSGQVVVTEQKQRIDELFAIDNRH